MKRTLLRFILPAAMISLTALAQTGTAATPAAPAAAPASTAAPATASSTKIGIISIEQAIMATNEGQRDLTALQKKFEPKQNELNSLNQEIENLKKQLQAQGDKLNEDARGTLVKNIETKQKGLQRQAEDAQGDWNTQRDEILGRILQKMAPIIDTYAKNNGFALILDASNPWPQGPVVWAAPPVDVTRTIVEAYNAQSGVAAPPAPAANTTPKPATRPAATRPAAPAAQKPPAPQR